jgi:hypothetical protein
LSEVGVPNQFNPYQEWLGLETSEPPDHYELLRISRFEAQPQVISAAAAAQMAKIRGIRPGARVADWQRMLDELAAAKNCLYNPASKARYDEELTKRGPETGRIASGTERTDLSGSSISRGDWGSAGKNLLPPSIPASKKRMEQSPISDEPLPAGPSLNPLPPTKGGKSATPVVITSSLSMPVESGAAADITPVPKAAPDHPTLPAPQAGSTAPSVPLSGATRYGAPIASPVRTPMPGVPFPGAALPGTAFPPAPVPSVANPGAPLPTSGMPAAFPAGGVPGAPVYPQPMPAAGWQWPSSNPVPSGAPAPMSPNSVAPFSPGAVVPVPSIRTIPVASTSVSNPQNRAAGQPIIDDLLRERASPVDELGLGGSQATERVQALRIPDDGSGGLPRVRSRRASGPTQQSLHAAVIAGGIALVAIAIVAVVVVMNYKRRNEDTIADLSSNNSKTQPINPAPKTPDKSAPSRQKVADVSKTNPLVADSQSRVAPADLPRDPMAGPPNELLPNKTTLPDNAAAPENPPAKQPVPDEPKPTPEPSKPVTDAPKPPPSDPAVSEKILQLLSAARTKLGERNQEAAKKLVAEAGELAASDEQHDMVDRVESLEKYVAEFWSAVHDSVKGLKAADEIDLGSTKVIVVEAGAEALMIHVGGQNRRYRVNQLPSGLAVGLALRWLDPKKPENKVFVGAFYLVDPKTGPEQAKQAWDEAAAAGVDVKNLLPLLQAE